MKEIKFLYDFIRQQAISLIAYIVDGIYETLFQKEIFFAERKPM